jgi:hypothetical protein
VHEAVVARAEQDEVVELRLASAGPMTDVMGVQEPFVLAAGVATAPVARLQRPPHRRRDRARLSADRDRHAVALDDLDERGVAGQALRRLRGERRAVLEHVGALGRLDVDDDLVALAGRPGVSVARQGHVRQRNERLGARRSPRFRGTAVLGPLALLEPVARRIERAHEESPVLGRQPRANDQRAVLFPGVAGVGQGVELVCLCGSDLPVGAHRALELGGGQVPSELEQLLLVPRLGDPGQRPYLGVRELAAGKGLVDQRQLDETPRDPHVLARRPRRQCAAPGQPLGRRACCKAAAAIDLGHELQPAAGPRVDVRGERRDLVLELVEGHVRERRRVLSFDNSHVGRLVNAPDVSFKAGRLRE